MTESMPSASCHKWLGEKACSVMQLPISYRLLVLTLSHKVHDY